MVADRGVGAGFVGDGMLGHRRRWPAHIDADRQVSEGPESERHRVGEDICAPWDRHAPPSAEVNRLERAPYDPRTRSAPRYRDPIDGERLGTEAIRQPQPHPTAAAGRVHDQTHGLVRVRGFSDRRCRSPRPHPSGALTDGARRRTAGRAGEDAEEGHSSHQSRDEPQERLQIGWVPGHHAI